MTEAPSDKIDLTHIEDTPEGTKVVAKTHFMSQGLLGRFMKLIPNPAMLTAVDIDSDFIDLLLNELYAPRRQAGQKIDPDFQHPELSIAECEKALSWIKEHVLGFFLRRIAHSKKLYEANSDVLKAIESSTIGLPSSPTPTPSSGPSAAGPAT